MNGEGELDWISPAEPYKSTTAVRVCRLDELKARAREQGWTIDLGMEIRWSDADSVVEAAIAALQSQQIAIPVARHRTSVARYQLVSAPLRR